MRNLNGENYHNRLKLRIILSNQTNYFMKKANYILITLAFTTTTFCFQSCKDEKNAAEATVETPKEVAIEILQEKDKVQYAEAIYTSENAEFCKGEYVQSLP